MVRSIGPGDPAKLIVGGPQYAVEIRGLLRERTAAGGEKLHALSGAPNEPVEAREIERSRRGGSLHAENLRAVFTQ